MKQIISGKNQEGQEVIIGEISMKLNPNKELRNPVLKMLRLKNNDIFFFQYDEKKDVWFMEDDLTFVDLKSKLIETYQQMDTSGYVSLEEFQEMLFLKHFRHLPSHYVL